MTDKNTTKTAWEQFKAFGKQVASLLRLLGEQMSKLRGMNPQQIKSGIAGMMMLGAALILYIKGGVHPLALASVAGIGAMLMLSAMRPGKKQVKRRRAKRKPTKSKKGAMLMLSAMRPPVKSRLKGAGQSVNPPNPKKGAPAK